MPGLILIQQRLFNIVSSSSISPICRYKIIIKNKKLPPAGGPDTINGSNDDSDFEDEHFINEMSSDDEVEEEEDVVLPLELYNIRR